jgi:isovaleryl-CoA dehydrogenase
LFFDNCQIPKANLLGVEGKGLTHMMRNLEIERLTLGAMSVGIAERCKLWSSVWLAYLIQFVEGVEVMVEYSQNRKAFGKPIHEFGQIQRYIGDSFALMEAAKALTYNTAKSISPVNRNRIGSDAVKVWNESSSNCLSNFFFQLFASMVGKQVADNAIQVLGGAGYCRDYNVERLWRDAKLLEIGGGTLEAHEKNLTKDILEALK